MKSLMRVARVILILFLLAGGTPSLRADEEMKVGPPCQNLEGSCSFVIEVAYCRTTNSCCGLEAYRSCRHEGGHCVTNPQQYANYDMCFAQNCDCF